MTESQFLFWLVAIGLTINFIGIFLRPYDVWNVVCVVNVTYLSFLLGRYT